MLAGVAACARVVFFETRWEIAAQADIGLGGITLASQKVNVVHWREGGSCDNPPAVALRAMAGSLRQGFICQAGLPAEALAKAGGEGSRTPVRNAVSDGIYTFSMRSKVSETLGPRAALCILASCYFSEKNPAARFFSQPSKCRHPPQKASGF